MGSMSILKECDEDDLRLGHVEELKTVQSEDFNLYLNWMCHGKIHPMGKGPGEYQVLFQLYLLGEILRDEEFRHDILDSLVSHFNTGQTPNFFCFLPEPDAINWVYSNTEKTCILRKLVACMYAKRAGQEFMKDKKGKFSMAFLEDVINALIGDGVKNKDISDEDAEEFKKAASQDQPSRKKQKR